MSLTRVREWRFKRTSIIITIIDGAIKSKHAGGNNYLHIFYVTCAFAPGKVIISR